jgi:hypothetical protein
VVEGRDLGAGPILRALVNNLAVIQLELVHTDDLAAGDGGNMEVLDTMQVGQRKGKALSLSRRNKLIDINRMNRLLTLVIATTVAKGLPSPSGGIVRREQLPLHGLPPDVRQQPHDVERVHEVKKAIQYGLVVQPVQPIGNLLGVQPSHRSGTAVLPAEISSRTGSTNPLRARGGTAGTRITVA